VKPAGRGGAARNGGRSELLVTLLREAPQKDGLTGVGIHFKVSGNRIRRCAHGENKVSFVLKKLACKWDVRCWRKKVWRGGAYFTGSKRQRRAARCGGEQRVTQGMKCIGPLKGERPVGAGDERISNKAGTRNTFARTAPRTRWGESTRPRNTALPDLIEMKDIRGDMQKMHTRERRKESMKKWRGGERPKRRSLDTNIIAADGPLAKR